MIELDLQSELDTDHMTKLLTFQDIELQPEDEYMGSSQLEYFKAQLLSLASELQGRINSGVAGMKGVERFPDVSDFASFEEQRGLSLRMMLHDRAELSKVQAALKKMQNGDYGWCDVTGEPIGLQRLKVSPASLVTVESMRFHEIKSLHVSGNNARRN